MEISDAIKYYIEENGLERVPNTQFYFFLADLCKDEVKPYRFILRFSEFDKLFSEFINTTGSAVFIQQIAYKWAQISGFRQDLIEGILRNLSMGIRKTFIKPVDPKDKKLPLIIRYNKYYFPETKYKNFLLKGELISDIILGLKINKEKRLYESKLNSSRKRLRKYLAEKELQDRENERIALEKARKEQEKERKKEKKRLDRLEEQAKKEREEAIKESIKQADEIKKKLGVDKTFMSTACMIGVLIIISLLIYIPNFSSSNHFNNLYQYLHSITHNEFFSAITFLGVFMLSVVVIIYSIAIIGNVYLRINYKLKLWYWKKRNPNHRAAPYL